MGKGKKMTTKEAILMVIGIILILGALVVMIFGMEFSSYYFEKKGIENCIRDTQDAKFCH